VSFQVVKWMISDGRSDGCLPQNRVIMARTEFRERVFQLRSERRQTARQQALLVPWARLEESASAYLEWQIFALWIRAACASATRIPEAITAELRSRCPDFQGVDGCDSLTCDDSFWHVLWEWIQARHFAKCKAEGWFEAVMFYAGENLRSEQLWRRWEIVSDGVSRLGPHRVPSFGEWRDQVLATYFVEQTSERARALAQLNRVDDCALRSAAAALIDSRALALWVASISQPDSVIPEVARQEVQKRIPALAVTRDRLVWSWGLFRCFVRLGNASVVARATAEDWGAVLRYHVVHHPRYHRVVHYFRRCQEAASLPGHGESVTFSAWLQAADEYVVAIRK